MAGGRKTLLAAGRATVTVKVPKAGKRRLRRLRRAQMTLKVSVKDAAGKTTRFSKVISLRR